MTYIMSNGLTVRKLILNILLKQDKYHLPDFTAENHIIEHKKTGIIYPGFQIIEPIQYINE
jgi:hypothetical protein